jgi:hypothetical protein
MTPADALTALPDGLRKPLLEEYQRMVTDFRERRWLPSELSGGRFCEIVYTILEGYPGSYASAPKKPENFPHACAELQKRSVEPRSMRIAIPRLLPSIYEIRNNRNVGHVSGDIDPNHMDATFVLSSCNWVMAELVRVLHRVSSTEAAALIEQFTEQSLVLLWEVEDQTRRVLDTTLNLYDQILLLAGAAPVTLATLRAWTEHYSDAYLHTVLKHLHAKRFVEFNEKEGTVRLSPKGAIEASRIAGASLRKADA